MGRCQSSGLCGVVYEAFGHSNAVLCCLSAFYQLYLASHSLPSAPLFAYHLGSVFCVAALR